MGNRHGARVRSMQQKGARKLTKADFQRSWGVPPNVKTRYVGVKGIYWWHFSRFIRKRDFEKYGRCISCNKVIDDWRNAHAGHFVSAAESGPQLLFHPMNVHMQCPKCNNPMFTPHAGVGYAINLDKRYGLGTAQSIWDKKGILSPEWPEHVYVAKLSELGVEKTPDESGA